MELNASKEKILLYCMLLIFPLMPLSAQKISNAIKNASGNHPRLFFNEKEVGGLKKKIRQDSLLTKVYNSIVKNNYSILNSEPIKRELVGRRLLDKSRTCLNRILRLSFIYRLTGNEKYLIRAEKEMLASANFKDWNSDHFLDVAEMTAAMAIGYDWLYNNLTEKTRKQVKKAIIEKGLKPGLKEEWWVSNNNNWNQVCHGGLTLGALAICKDEPQLAQKIIKRAVKNVPIAMHEYAPDGAYPEGPGYWAYGSSYNVIFIDALESVLETDFGLLDRPGFMETPYYYLHAHGPTGFYYNYSDCKLQGAIAAPMFWFANKLEDPTLLYQEVNKVNSDLSDNRFLPFILIWSPPLDNIPKPGRTSWIGRGRTPVAMHRDSWDSSATYIGIKGGSPSSGHAHMDIGSFVIDAGGIRWATDLGYQDYHSLESKGIDLWNRAQDSQRWQIFRINNYSHNTLVIDNCLQRVEGFSKIIGYTSKQPRPHTIVDLTEIYDGQLKKLSRGIGLCEKRKVLLQDEIITNHKKVNIRWAMLTKAEVDINGSRAVLRQAGKKMYFKLVQPEKVNLKIYKTNPPPAEYDVSNPNTRMIGFETSLDSNSKYRFIVEMEYGNESQNTELIKPLSEW